MSSELAPICPWPGAKPYEIEQGRFFFGREREILEVRRRVERERLSVLAGPSGVGKTSLIRAGIVRDLLRSRARAESDESKIQMPPILLLRGWGATAADTAEDLLLSSLHKAVQDLQRVANEVEDKSLQHLLFSDYRTLSGALRGETFYEQVRSLCRAGGGLVLVLDQFEELLRAGADLKEGVIKAIIKVHRFEPRARLLLSLRQEFMHELRDLESFEQGLLNRTFYLSPMREPAVREAILKAGQAAGIDVTERAADTLLGWIKEVRHTQPIDLLSLQVILREIFNFALERGSTEGKGKKTVVIDVPTLEEYRSGQSLESLVGEALERWIARSLTTLDFDQPSDLLDWAMTPPPATLRATVVRVGAQIAPYLSSGGYKTAQEETSLMFRALHSDLGRLQSDALRDVSHLLSLRGIPLREAIKSLAFSEEYSESTGENLSGIARRDKWSPARTAEYLAMAFSEVLRRLRKGNILKPLKVEGTTVWELVHDRVGDPFLKWAEKQLGGWEDAVHRVVAARGEDVIITSNQCHQVIQSVCWRGCWIQPVGGAVLEEVVFRECDLRGTIFSNCVFKGGKFENCILDGVLFLDCQFERDSYGSPFIFSKCTQANGLTFRGTGRPGTKSRVEALVFEACTIDHLGMRRLCVEDVVRFVNGSRLLQALFEAVVSLGAKGRHPKIEFDETCILEYCAWDKTSERLIDYSRAMLFGSGVTRSSL